MYTRNFILNFSPSAFAFCLVCIANLFLCSPASAQERCIKAYAGTEMGTIRHELSMLNTDTGVTFPLQRIGKPGVWLAYYSTFKFQYNQYTTENPSVSSSLQKTSDATVAAFEDTRWAFRVGFGIPLRPKVAQETDKK